MPTIQQCRPPISPKCTFFPCSCTSPDLYRNSAVKLPFHNWGANKLPLLFTGRPLSKQICVAFITMNLTFHSVIRNSDVVVGTVASQLEGCKLNSVPGLACVEFALCPRVCISLTAAFPREKRRVWWFGNSLSVLRMTFLQSTGLLSNTNCDPWEGTPTDPCHHQCRSRLALARNGWIDVLMGMKS